MTNPTAGGVTASFAGLGDILIGEPKAIIAFAGRRVIQDTVKEELPEEFQTAEFVKEHGGIDMVVERKYVRSTVSTLLSIPIINVVTGTILISNLILSLNLSFSSKKRTMLRVTPKLLKKPLNELNVNENN